MKKISIFLFWEYLSYSKTVQLENNLQSGKIW